MLTGLSEEEQSLLEKHDEYIKEEQIVTRWNQQISNTLENLHQLKQIAADELDTHPDIASLPNASILQSLHDNYQNTLRRFDKELEVVIAEFENTSKAKNDYYVSSQQLDSAHKAYFKEYETAKQKSTAHESVLAELTEVEGRSRIIRDRLDSTKQALKTLGNPEVRFSDLRGKWCELHTKRSSLTEAQCELMTELSDGQIKATLIRGGVTKPLTDKIKEVFTGAKVRTAKIEELCKKIKTNGNPISKFQEILDELETLALRTQEDTSTQELPDTPILVGAGFTGTDLIRIIRIFTPESWLDVLLTPLEDEPVFSYRTREEEYISFTDASSGQQATSLLTALLNQGGVPLIIDQPEDDLDNKVVLKIIEQIWNSKPKRQIIFASHNANIVVNGDAEMVACCDYRVTGDQSGGQIAFQGAIDITDIRNEITVIMEGGEEAFRLRKQKYGF